MASQRKSARDRFRARTSTAPHPQGCHCWTGRLNAGGYGRISVDGKTIYAHVYAYELAYGPVPDGCEVDHLCNNTACVNAAHLEAKTHTANVLRSNAPPPSTPARPTAPTSTPTTPKIRSTPNRGIAAAARAAG